MDLRVGGHCIQSIDAYLKAGAVVPGYVLDQSRHIIRHATELVLNCDAFDPAVLRDACKDLTTVGNMEVDRLIAPRHTTKLCQQYAASLDTVINLAPVTRTFLVLEVELHCRLFTTFTPSCSRIGSDEWTTTMSGGRRLLPTFR